MAAIVELFTGPKKPKVPEPVKTVDAEAEKAKENRKRLAAGGTFAQTVVGSGLKTRTGV